MKEFKLWLEFEAVDPGNGDVENDFANVLVELPDGRRYGINVWTYKFLETAVKNDEASGANLNGLYLVPPDLFVKELTRPCIESAIENLLKKGNIEDCLNPSVIAKLNE
ncbi:hypothetical protein [Chryseolinea serpens]|uniref:hypothetical protein n=1 Tax=Chryseolinea serpens TaxID=947013 RepID=UPI000933301E|nr:hypothetical protein [Chryseolinea serpens]